MDRAPGRNIYLDTSPPPVVTFPSPPFVVFSSRRIKTKYPINNRRSSVFAEPNGTRWLIKPSISLRQAPPATGEVLENPTVSGGRDCCQAPLRIRILFVYTRMILVIYIYIYIYTNKPWFFNLAPPFTSHSR